RRRCRARRWTRPRPPAAPSAWSWPCPRPNWPEDPRRLPMLSRRDFLRHSSLLALAPAVPGFLARTARAPAPQPHGRVLVVIQLDGGNDGINTVVPFADDGYARHRKTLRLARERLVKVNDKVGLHPSLSECGKLLQAGQLSIVQGVGYPNPNRSHFE